MPLSIHAVTPDFVAEVGDVALDKPLAPADLAAIRAAFTKYAILIFPDQTFDDESQLAFARNFGPLETTVFKARKNHELRLHENMADVGNLDSQNRILETNDRQRLYNLGNRLWHTDSSFKRLPAYCSMLHARSIPPIGGQTEYADMRAAYGRMSLYIASHAGAIRGMADAEARKLLDELTAHATQRQFVHSHRWRVGDLVIWDNRCTMHRGMEFDDQRYKRDMRRATVSDVAPTCEQMGLAVAAE